MRSTRVTRQPTFVVTQLFRWLALSRLFLVTGLIGLLFGGAYALQRAYLSDRLISAVVQPLQAIQAGWPGLALQVPAGGGFWLGRGKSAGLMLMRAVSDGPAQLISLCHQHSGGGGDPLSLYPMALVAGLPQGQDDPSLVRRAARNPLVLPERLAVGLPQVWVQGRLANEAQAAQLQLRVLSAGAQSARQWAVALADKVVEQGKASSEGYWLEQQVWLLWRDSVEDGNLQDALDGNAQRYSHGVQIRRVPSADCASGALEWQLYETESSAAQAQQAILWARMPKNAAAARLLRLPLAIGRYEVPTQPELPIEDQQLFEQGRAAGLIRGLPDGRVAVAPMDAASSPLIKPLYFSANGEHVRQQVRLANEFRYWLAVRLRNVESGELPVEADPARWRATAGGEWLSIRSGLPAVTARLHKQVPENWLPWQRVQAPRTWLEPEWPMAASASAPRNIQVSLPVRPGVTAAGQHLQVMVLGHLVSLKGAQLLAQAPACDGPACVHAGMLQWLTLELLPSATEVVLELVDQPLFNRLRPEASEQLRVRWQDEQPAWIAPSRNIPRQRVPRDITVLARDGTVLYESAAPTEAARQLGLQTLVGLGAAHEHSLAGLLARVDFGDLSQVLVSTTLEPGYQADLQAALTCQAQRDGQWIPEQRRCEAPQVSTADPRRISAAVLMDAHSGAVLAVASGKPLPMSLAVDELLAFDAFNPGSSPLRIPALQHQGGAAQAPGSSFKVLSALALEEVARNSQEMRKLLEGQTTEAIQARAQARGLAFSMSSACYPTPCGAHQPHVQNYNQAPAGRYATQGTFGLADALRNSVNTWFAMTAEMSDQTAKTGNADARPLGSDALLAQRPIAAMMNRLGMTHEMALDGGLLPGGFQLELGDVLLASPTQFDPIGDVHNIRQQSLGLRVQTTPLHMARLAAVIATGQLPQAHLLEALNQTQFQPSPKLSLDIPLNRIRTGMNEVVRAGTARGAFSDPSLGNVVARVFGKTGSAPMASRSEEQNCKHLSPDQALPMACLNNAWFIGFVEPGALPGESRTLAFAVQVSYSPLTGGAHAAPVIAKWLQTRLAANTHH